MPLADKAYLQINQSLFSLTHAYETRMAQYASQNVHQLSLADCSTLMVLGQFAPLNSRQLSKLMDINFGTISVYVQRLVDKGLVQRERDQADRRNWWLTLTEPGQAAFAWVMSGAVEYTRDFLSTLDQAEQETLHRLLLKASHSLGFDWQ